MDKTKIKYLVGIYAAAMCIMGMLVPVPIVASVAAAFPNENIAAVQMIIGIIPLMMALSAMLALVADLHTSHPGHASDYDCMAFRRRR